MPSAISGCSIAITNNNNISTNNKGARQSTKTQERKWKKRKKIFFFEIDKSDLLIVPEMAIRFESIFYFFFILNVCCLHFTFQQMFVSFVCCGNYQKVEKEYGKVLVPVQVELHIYSATHKQLCAYIKNRMGEAK